MAEGFARQEPTQPRASLYEEIFQTVTLTQRLQEKQKLLPFDSSVKNLEECT